MIDTPILRPYQVAAVEAVRDQYLAGVRRTLVVKPTGTGKTMVFAEIARRAVARGKRVLVIAHRTELLSQACRKLGEAGIVASLEQGNSRGAIGSVVVASVQTLRGKRLASWPVDAFDLIIVDEAHHAAAKGYRAIFDHFAGSYLLGVTATPDRGDGVGLGNVFESCAYRYELRKAITDGWLVPLRARRIKVASVDLDHVHTRAGDLATDELAAVMAAEKALHEQAIPLVEQSEDRPTIAFAVDVAHAHKLAEVCNRYQPGVARALDGTASDDVRRATLAAFHAREFRILINCALFTEGFDEPMVACVAMIRPTKSRALYTQMVGRGTRLYPGKVDCLILDITPDGGRHRLISPADVLAGGDLPEDAAAAAKAALDAGGDVDIEAMLVDLEDARQQRQRKLAHAVRAVAAYEATEIDPFFDEKAPDLDDGEKANDAQLSALETAGLKRIPPETTYARAQFWIDQLRKRRQKGLCTLKQARYLHRAGYARAKEYTFDEANQIIGADMMKRRVVSRSAVADA